MPRRQPEKAVQTAIKTYLRLRGARVYDTSQPRAAMVTAGLADLIVFDPRCGLVFVEVKAPFGRLTEAQLTFAAACRSARVPYLVSHSAAELADQLHMLEVG